MPLGGHLGGVCRGICHGHHPLLLRPEGGCSYFGICQVSAGRSAKASASFLRAGLLRQVLMWAQVSATGSAGYIYIYIYICHVQPQIHTFLGPCICQEICRLYIYSIPAPKFHLGYLPQGLPAIYIYMVSYTPIIPKSTYSGICHEICQLYIYVTFGP